MRSLHLPLRVTLHRLLLSEECLILRHLRGVHRLLVLVVILRLTRSIAIRL